MRKVFKETLNPNFKELELLFHIITYSIIPLFIPYPNNVEKIWMSNFLFHIIYLQIRKTLFLAHFSDFCIVTLPSNLKLFLSRMILQFADELFECIWPFCGVGA